MDNSKSIFHVCIFALYDNNPIQSLLSGNHTNILPYMEADYIGPL